ncbi:hypothetical protein DES40_0591 [Litorimonas taeanensis]|uniref:Uncharacterized protein n=2 Tax=Litorimonas taeanensis TaxID=568099 RepID=A0A420WJV1_9PROT|nr:hypothetical protein DES40_0591 [Litorimonas taeanensis]
MADGALSVMFKFAPVVLISLGLMACENRSDEAGGDVNLSRPVISDSTDRNTDTPGLPPVPKSLRLEDIDFTTYSTELAKPSGLAEGQSRIEAIDAVRLYFAPEEGSHIIQTSQSSFDRPDGSVLIMSASQLADDSVQSQEIYLILTGEKGNQKLAAFGLRHKCWRGENTTEWQTALCP